MSVFTDVSEQEREKLSDLINRLLAVNFVVKELERERYYLARRYRDDLKRFFALIGWEFLLDDRHECVAVISANSVHRRALSREESIALLIIRLIYEEKRRGLNLSQFPLTNKHEIRSKYETFRLAFPGKTRFQEIMRLFSQYKFLQALDDDLGQDDCRFRLFHTLLYALDMEELENVQEKIRNYGLEVNEGMFKDEVAETNTAR